MGSTRNRRLRNVPFLIPNNNLEGTQKENIKKLRNLLLLIRGLEVTIGFVWMVANWA